MRLVIEPLLIALGPVTPAYAALAATGPAPSGRGQIVLNGPIGTHVNIFYTLNAYRKYTRNFHLIFNDKPSSL